MSPAAADSFANPIRAILVDDEPLMREHLRERLAAHPEVEIVGEAHGVRSAADLVATAKPDVIFLDVQMPPDNGFNLLPLLEWVEPQPAVVFVTAYDKYALRAFETHAIDYLTKPVHPGRLVKTIARLKQTLADRRRAAKADEDQNPPSSGTSSGPLEVMDLVRLQDGGYIRMVEVGQIAAAQVQGDYTRIFAAEGKPIMIKSTLSKWEHQLPAALFSKISRRLLVNRRQIKQIVPLDRENAHVFLNGIAEPLLLSRIELRRLKAVL
jgi:two-component system LytT family response regulator